MKQPNPLAYHPAAPVLISRECRVVNKFWTALRQPRCGRNGRRTWVQIRRYCCPLSRLTPIDELALMVIIDFPRDSHTANYNCSRRFALALMTMQLNPNTNSGIICVSLS
jgi:hypothetical protein